MESLNIILSTPPNWHLQAELLQLIAKSNCFLEESRFLMLGNGLYSIIRISGQWNSIAKLEDYLNALKQEEPHIFVDYKRSHMTPLSGDFLPYVLQLIGLNAYHLTSDFVLLLNNYDTIILDLQTEPFKSHFSDSKLMTVNMRVQIPSTLNISDFRERFMLLCDEFNIDGLLEPEKGIK